MNSKQDFVSISVFSFSSFIILFSSISVIFPALLSSFVSGSPYTMIHPLEMSIFAIPFILTNIIFFTLYFLITRKYSNFKNILSRILSFDISKKLGVISVLIIIAIYVVLSFPETLESDPWPDFRNVQNQQNLWLKGENFSDNIDQLHVKLFFLYISEQLFDNFRILPLLASASLLFLVYTFTVKISSKQLPGIIAVLLTLQSGIFRIYDTTPTYANFWVLFHLLSIYLIEKTSYSSFLGYILSFLAKPLTLAYLPFNLFYILRTTLSTKKKLLSIIPYILIGVAMFFVLFIFANEANPNLGIIFFNLPKFISGFTIFPIQLRFDLLIMMGLFPLNFLLYKKSKVDKRAQSLMILISGIILIGPMLTGFFNYMLNPYRLVPLVIFCAISVGYLFGNVSLWKKNLN